MLKKLRLRLALLSALLSGLVLLGLGAATVLLLQISRDAQWQAGHREMLNRLEGFLQSETAVSLNWLESQEIDNQMVLGIQDAGNELRFQGAFVPQTPRETLLQRAREYAAALEENRVILTSKPYKPQSVQFEMRGDKGEKYLCDVSVFAVKESFRSFTTVRVIPQTEVFWLWFICAGALGLVLLFGCGYWLSGRALRPVQKANIRQAEFTAAASHELKSPLASIRALSGEIMAEPDKAEDYAAIIDRECGRLARLINDLLVLSGSDATTWEVKLETLEPDLLLIETHESLALLARKQNHRLQIELPEDALPPIKGDRERLEQLLTVLISNALSYTPPATVVTLGARAAGKTVRLYVADEGSGLNKEEKERVFERFYRADKSRTDKSHFGLGLSVARELAALHGGRLWVEDNVPQGAVFILSLPIEAAGAAAYPEKRRKKHCLRQK